MASKSNSDKAVDLYKQGELPADIARSLGVAKSTVLRWVKGIQLPSDIVQEMATKRSKRRANGLIRGGPVGDKRRWERKRAEGANSNPNHQDALCIGLYMAEGSKKPATRTSSPKWNVANAERIIIRMMVEWAKRAGQAEGKFRAQIQVYQGQSETDEQVKEYWAEAGVPADRITVRRLLPKENNGKPHRILRYGTCYMDSAENGVRLYQYLLGQREGLLRSNQEDGQQGFMPLASADPGKETGAATPMTGELTGSAVPSPLPARSYTDDTRSYAITLYKNGLFKTEVSTQMGIPLGTIATWISKTCFTDEENANIQKYHAERRAIQRQKGHLIYLQACDQDRRTAYQQGLESQPTVEDAYCVGLYWGDGAKHLCAGRSPEWKMSNSDREIIQAMIGWAIRLGQEPGRFSAQVIIYEGLSATEDEIKKHWAETGIPIENISLSILKGRKKADGAVDKTPWGTCHLIPNGNRTRLFWLWRGQLDRLTGDAELQQQSRALLDSLAQRGMADQEAEPDTLAQA